MNRREEIDALLADAAERIAALGEEAMREIREKQAVADAAVSRHGEAARELGEVEAEIVRLSAEREEIPNLAYRAGLDQQWEEEDRLKERYANLKPAIEALEERRSSLREEIAGLSPRDSGHPTDSTAHQYGLVARVAHYRRRELEDLRDRLTKALDDALDPVASVHDNTKALTWQLGHDREWSRREVVA